MLDNQQTLELLKKAKNGDNLAKEELLLQNSPLIKSVIKFYKNRGVEYQDLYQLGCLGFIKAINNFDESYLVKFTTYAVPMVAGEVKRFLRDDGAIKVSRSIKAQQIEINKYIAKYKSENNLENPTIEQIANHFNMEQSEVVFAMDSSKVVISLNEKQDEDSSRSKTLMETLAEEDKTESLLNNIMLSQSLKSLTDKDKRLIYLRYFLDKTQTEIAKDLGVSQVQVSRLETKIIEKLKQKFEIKN